MQIPPCLWLLTLMCQEVKRAYVIRFRLLYCILVPGMMSVGVIVYEIRQLFILWDLWPLALTFNVCQGHFNFNPVSYVVGKNWIASLWPWLLTEGHQFYRVRVILMAHGIWSSCNQSYRLQLASEKKKELVQYLGNLTMVCEDHRHLGYLEPFLVLFTDIPCIKFVGQIVFQTFNLNTLGQSHYYYQ